MHKLQDTIDIVFSNATQKLGPHEPSEIAIQRDSRFVELASKIEKLKQARLLAQSRQ